MSQRVRQDAQRVRQDAQHAHMSSVFLCVYVCVLLIIIMLAIHARPAMGQTQANTSGKMSYTCLTRHVYNIYIYIIYMCDYRLQARPAAGNLDMFSGIQDSPLSRLVRPIGTHSSGIRASSKYVVHASGRHTSVVF